MNVEQIREFFGYCTLINVAILMVTFLALPIFREKASSLHAKAFNIDQAVVRAMYFNYLANYKVIVIVFNLVPYLALTFIE